MQIRSQSPYEGFLFRQYNPRAELNVVATAWLVYEIVDENTLKLLDDQPSVQLDDKYTGPETPPRHLISQADFVPYKPGTDVTVLAKSYSPSKMPEKSWICGIRVAGREKLLRVHGPRKWIPSGLKGWKMGPAKATKMVPLSYYEAFGGPRAAGKDEETPPEYHQYNPLGRGWLHPKFTPVNDEIEAPQIEAVNEPIIDWKQDYKPQGMAPIAPVWKFRQQHCGTYDETWLKTQHPFLPPDFDYRFYNCAHPDLVFEEFLSGGETVEIANLHPRFGQIKIKLPKKQMAAVRHRRKGGIDAMPMVMDGVHFDLLADRPTLRLTWRTGFEDGGNVKLIDVLEVPEEKKQLTVAARQKTLAGVR